jgi:hypothetical protein
MLRTARLRRRFSVFAVFQLESQQFDFVVQRRDLVCRFAPALAQGLELVPLVQHLLVDFADARLGTDKLDQKRLRLGVANLLKRCRGVALEPKLPGRDRCHRNGDQHAGQAGRLLADHPDQDNRRRPHRQGWPMGITDQQGHAPDVGNEGLGTAHGHTDQLIYLGQGNDDGGGIGEADNHRMGEEVHHHAELEHTQRELDHADQQGQQDRQGDEVLRARRRQRRQRGGREQRSHRHRAGTELVRRAPQGRHRHRQEGGIQAIVGRHAGQLGIGHGLRH